MSTEKSLSTSQVPSALRSIGIAEAASPSPIPSAASGARTSTGAAKAAPSGPRAICGPANSAADSANSGPYRGWIALVSALSSAYATAARWSPGSLCASDRTVAST